MERAIVPLLADGTLRADSRSGTFVAEVVETGMAAEVMGPGPVPAFTASLAPRSVPAPLRGHQSGPTAIVASLYAPNNKNIGQNDHWIREIVRAMEIELAEHGHHAVFINRVPQNAYEAVPLRDSLAQALANENLSGLALVAFDLEAQEIEKAYSDLGRPGFPVVSAVGEELSLPVPHVMFDDRRAGFQAGQYFLDQGHRALTVLLPERAPWAEERLIGVRAAATRAGLKPADIAVLRGDDRAWKYNSCPLEIAAHAVELAFDFGWKPHGPVICATDMVAISLMQLLSEKGYSVGPEIPILGFDDHELSRDAGLTTLRPPMRAMGREVVRLLLGSPESRSEGCQVRLCSQLILRRSTMAKVPPKYNLSMSQTPLRLTAEPMELQLEAR